jgi:polyphenol oxidase
VRWREKAGLRWLEFDLFKGHRLIHAVFSRQGGVSTPPFDSLNFEEEVGDAATRVEENRRRAMAALGLDRLIYARQRHGTVLRRVDGLSLGTLPECDGLIVSELGVGIMIKHADCQVAILYDPRHEVVAAVHAGWRGLVQEIYATAVQRLAIEMGSDPGDLLVAVAPSLGPEAAEFLHHEQEFPPSFQSFRRQGCYFDLWEIARWQLLQAGIRSHHLEVARLSTYSSPGDFYSHRREKKTGRNGTIVAICGENHVG